MLTNHWRGKWLCRPCILQTFQHVLQNCHSFMHYRIITKCSIIPMHHNHAEIQSLFLFYTNYLPEGLKTSVRLFANYTIMHLTVWNAIDAGKLRDDLDKLENLLAPMTSVTSGSPAPLFNGRSVVIKLTLTLSPIPSGIVHILILLVKQVYVWNYL